MSENNPYAAPQSNLESNSSIEASYYVVSQKKFMVLSITTLGIYFMFWFWKNWVLVKEREGSSIWPIPRALFMVFFTHSLFKKIEESGANYNLPALNSYATIFVVAAVLNNLSDRWVTNGIMILLITVAFLGCEVWAVWQAQQQANVVSGDDQGQSNDKFSASNIVLIVMGSLLWLAFIVGSFIDPATM